jgi:hypothetical protein
LLLAWMWQADTGAYARMRYPLVEGPLAAMSNDAKPLCRSCRFLGIYNGILAGIAVTLERCRQGIPGELDKRQCGAYEREPGSDDE